MNKTFYSLLPDLLLTYAGINLMANNIRVTNLTTTGQNIYTLIQLDINWESS